jgi:hypothetical protein
MREPTHCALWTKPELVNRPKASQFSRIATFVDESHHWRYLLQCRECRQLYFFEFYEEVDWEGGNDPQYSTYIPVESDTEIEALRETTPSGLLQFVPRLQKNYPRDAEQPTVRWIK